MSLLGVRGAPATAPGRLNQNLFDKLQFEVDPQNTQRGRSAPACLPVPREGRPLEKCAISVRDSRFAGYTAARARQNPSWRAPPSHVFQQESEVRTEMA